MTFLDALLDRVWPAHRVVARALDSTGTGYAANVTPPPRYAGPLGIGDAVTIPAVYRAVQLLMTSVSQLSLDIERQGQLVPDNSPLVRRPSLDMSRSDFLELTVSSLATNGNAFWFKETAGTGELVSLDVLDPRFVTVVKDPKTGRISYGHKGNTYTGAQIEHLHLFRLPGQLRGLGPIQAAQESMRGTIDMREHMARWFTNTGQPAGILSSDQELTPEDARAYRNAWNGLDPYTGDAVEQTGNPSGIKVLGKGTSYHPILLSPKDALWLDAQAFSTLEVARLFGVPSSLMYAAIEGNSQTYSNVEQEWLAFARFSLMQYLRKIEEAFTNVTPRGQTVRFNLETLLRSDTKTRYQSYQLGITAGWLDPDEVRATENLPPLTAAQRDRIANTRPAPAPAPTDSQESPA